MPVCRSLTVIVRGGRRGGGSRIIGFGNRRGEVPVLPVRAPGSTREARSLAALLAAEGDRPLAETVTFEMVRSPVCRAGQSAGSASTRPALEP